MRVDVPVALAVALCIAWGIYPGDVSFIGDEPMLIENAIRANAEGVLAEHGLRGTKGVVYGPLPTWIYQGLLYVSHDPVVWVVLRALACAVTIALSLFRLAQLLDLPRAFVPVVLCSPWLWYFSRVLWDNSFVIPISALCFVAYAAFLRDGRPFALALVIGAGAALACIHLMAIAFLVPLAIHAIVFRGREIALLWWAAVPCVAAASIVAVPYAKTLAASRPTRIEAGGVDAWLFPLGGARILSAHGIEATFGPAWMAAGGMAIGVAEIISLLVVSASAVGLGVAVALVASTRGRRENPLRAHACGLALAILLGQILLSGTTASTGFVHYFNATWIVFALFAWLALERLAARPRLVASLAVAQGVAALTVVAFVALRIHHVYPSREGYGATLANQLVVARELERRGAPPDVPADVQQVQLFPVALRVLRTLVGRAPRHEDGGERLRLVHASDDPLDGRIVVVERVIASGR